MKIYLAARLARGPELLAYAGELELMGHTVTSRWIRGGHGENSAEHHYSPEELADFAEEDLEDINAAALMIAFTEEPSSGHGRGGRHVEAGYAMGTGTPLAIVGPRENAFYCRRRLWHFETWEACRAWLETIAP